MDVSAQSVRVVEHPDVVTIYADIESIQPDTLRIYNLNERRARIKCGAPEFDETRIYITSRGSPLSVWSPEGKDSGFEWVYLGDEQVKVLNPERTTDLYVTWYKGMQVELIYLRKGKKVIEVQQDGKIERIPVWERLDPTLMGFRSCGPDEIEATGGHKKLQAFQLPHKY